MRRLLLAVIALVAAVVALVLAGRVGLGPVVITREDEQKIILFLSNPRTVTEPGWSLRWPLVEDVRSYDRRLLYLNSEPLLIQTKDEERILVDTYVVWRISNAVQFFESFRAGMERAEQRIGKVLLADVREVIGQHTLREVLTGKRLEIMRIITEQVRSALADSGIEAVDVRINRTDLPPGTEENVYARMKTDRERLARKYRAEGEEKARRIRAEADREAQVIVANARRDAEIARGEGDAEATRIYAESYSLDPEFYDFVRSLEAYRKTIGENTTLVLSPNAEFFRFLESARPASPAPAPAPAPPGPD